LHSTRRSVRPRDTAAAGKYIPGSKRECSICGGVGVMAEPQPAQLAFLTDPEPGVVLLNVQTDGELQRFRINRDQLFVLNKDTADILMKGFPVTIIMGVDPGISGAVAFYFPDGPQPHCG
jgi:hypothetical protein